MYEKGGKEGSRTVYEKALKKCTSCTGPYAGQLRGWGRGDPRGNVFPQTPRYVLVLFLKFFFFFKKKYIYTEAAMRPVTVDAENVLDRAL